MKLVSFILLIVSGFLSAQTFYTRLGSGYGVGISPEVFTNTRQTSHDNTVYESEKFSFGEGVYFNAALGYNITSNAAVEIELNYMKGAALKTTYYVLNPPPYYLDQKLEMEGKSYSINPSLILSTKWELLNPYIKFGAIVGYAGLSEKIDQEASGAGTNSTQISRSEIELEFHDSFALGINAAIGTYINITESIALFADISSKNLSYSPEKVTMEKYTFNGVDRTYQIPQDQKEMEYVESYSSGDKNKGIQTEYPFNSIVFSFGLKLGL